MKKFEEKVEMVALTVLLLGLGICIGTGIIEMVMFTECFTYIAIALVCAITLMVLCFWALIAIIPAFIDEVEED